MTIFRTLLAGVLSPDVLHVYLHAMPLSVEAWFTSVGDLERGVCRVVRKDSRSVASASLARVTRQTYTLPVFWV